MAGGRIVRVELSVTAEGVTTQAQVDLLREMGCGFAQGYLYSPPVELKQAITLLRRRIAERDQRNALRTRADAGTAAGNLQSC